MIWLSLSSINIKNKYILIRFQFIDLKIKQLIIAKNGLNTNKRIEGNLLEFAKKHDFCIY